MKKHKLLSIIITLLLLISTLFSCANTTPPDNEDDDKVTDNSNPDNTSNDTENKDEYIRLPKKYCTATIDEDFSPNLISVWVYHEYAYYDYSVEDFKEINCISVKEVTPADFNPTYSSGYRIIGLSIPGNDKANVLSAIKELEKREDVWSAAPSYNEDLDSES